MTDRKPAHLQPGDWVERQIREAQERGAFDGLPGAGKPLPGLDQPWSAERWAVDWARREGADLSAALPPALLLRRERDALLADLDTVPGERDVRERLEHFNTAVRDAYRRPQLTGPPMTVGLFDVEQEVAGWRERRAGLEAAAAAALQAAAAAPAPGAAAPGRRSWWRPAGWRRRGSATPRR